MGRVSRLVEKYELKQQQASRLVEKQPSPCSPGVQAKIDVKVQNLSTKKTLSPIHQQDGKVCSLLNIKKIGQVNDALIEEELKHDLSALAGDSIEGASTNGINEENNLFLNVERLSKTAVSISKASHYFLLLNAIDEHHLAQLLKTVDSAIYLEKKPGKQSGLLKNKEGVLYFKDMLESAEEAMKHDKLAALALLQRMRSSEWAKNVMRFHSSLKSHHQALYHQIVDQMVKDSGHLFAEIIHQIDRQELFNRIQGGDKAGLLPQACPHLVQLAYLWDQVKFTVIEEVLKEEGVKQRTAMIELFIRVAYHALEKRDFSTAASVWAGLQSESIQESRLKMSWAGLTKESAKMYQILSEKLGKMSSATYEKDVKRMAELPVKIRSIPLLTPYLAMLAKAKERQKALSHQILEEEKQLQEDVSFFNKCKILKREKKIEEKIEELEGELKEIHRENAQSQKDVEDPSLIKRIENIASRLKLAQTMQKAFVLPSDKELLAHSIHLAYIHNLEKEIEKYDRQMRGIIEVILKFADQMGHYLRDVSHYDTGHWVKRHLSSEEGKKVEEQAYKRSLILEPLELRERLSKKQNKSA